MNEFDLKNYISNNPLMEKEEQKEIEEGKAAYEYEKGKEAGEKIEKEKMEESEEITETPKLTKEGLKNMIKEKITSILNEEEDAIDDEVVIDDEKITDDTEEEIPSVPVSGGKDVDAILDLLTQAREESESLGDEKLSDQIGNTITFLTRTHLSR